MAGRGRKLLEWGGEVVRRAGRVCRVVHVCSHTRRLSTSRVRLGMPLLFFFFSSRRRHTRLSCDWSSHVCSSDRSEEQTSALQSHYNLVCRLLEVRPLLFRS